jgi:redox-sensitive bicupin YhaK (pirin superfamily)
MMTGAQISPVVAGGDLKIREAFEAKNFGEQQFGGMIDPVVMVDHFRMTAPTFDPHPHAGISAVTYLFEDAVGLHFNYDSLGNRGPIRPGALHWFAAGRGAIHTEQPQGADKCIHGLQIFVNLPATKKLMPPYAVHVEPEEMPELNLPGARVRIVVGSSNGVEASYTEKLPERFTILDGFLSGDNAFEHQLPIGWNAMVYLVSGKLEIEAAGRRSNLVSSQAAGVSSPDESVGGCTTIRLIPDGPGHFVILSGPALNEPIVKHGPIVMNSSRDIEDRVAAYMRGDFGELVL